MSRNIISPDLMPMGSNRCYRINAIHEDFGDDPRQNAASVAQPIPGQYVEQDLYAEDDDDDEESGAYKVVESATGGFMLTMPVPSAFYGSIIGMKGATRRRLESETQTEIQVPPRATEGNANRAENVIIRGETRPAVVAAGRKLKLLIVNLRERMRPTHFVSAPLEADEITENYDNFKREILSNNFPGIDESLFMTTGCLHQTLVTCCLLNNMERAQGVDILNSCQDLLSSVQTPLIIKVQGLEIMNDDPSAVRILYAKVISEDLQKLANLVAARFKKSGLSSEKHNNDHVKLHMTILNKRYGETDRKQFSRQNFDAREILKRYSDYYFGTVECSELRLCAMRSEDNTSENYKITGTLKFPVL